MEASSSSFEPGQAPALGMPFPPEVPHPQVPASACLVRFFMERYLPLRSGHLPPMSFPAPAFTRPCYEYWPRAYLSHLFRFLRFLPNPTAHCALRPCRRLPLIPPYFPRQAQSGCPLTRCAPREGTLRDVASRESDNSSCSISPTLSQPSNLDFIRPLSSRTTSTHQRRRLPPHLISSTPEPKHRQPTYVEPQSPVACSCARAQKAPPFATLDLSDSTASRSYLTLLLSPRPTLVHAQYDRAPQSSCVCVCTSPLGHIYPAATYITLHYIASTHLQTCLPCCRLSIDTFRPSSRCPHSTRSTTAPRHPSFRQF